MMKNICGFRRRMSKLGVVLPWGSPGVLVEIIKNPILKDCTAQSQCGLLSFKSSCHAWGFDSFCKLFAADLSWVRGAKVRPTYFRLSSPPLPPKTAIRQMPRPCTFSLASPH
eukprot:GHVT01087569.1.p1 GENE.GHVT01087569.1~~GHVT01087569.1.p1  ORF type:complete len:112 (+),score=1.38 GHVT01087569.1:204-539(+)